jgi:hypothetical protein
MVNQRKSIIMKTKVFCLALLALVLSISVNAQSHTKKPVFLGERLVNDRLDRDVVAVTAGRGEFRAIQIRVKGASVDFHTVIVVYGNGRTQEVEMRNTIRAGGSSRIIDLIGDERIIKQIDFLYDANTIRGRKAVVRVFGIR